MSDFTDYVNTILSPTHEYKFDDASGGAVNSGSEPGNDLAEGGSIAYQAVTSGEYAAGRSVMSFDGTTDYLVDFAPTNLNSASGTLVFMFRCRGLGVTQNLLMARPEASGATNLMLINVDPLGTLRYLTRDGAGNTRLFLLGNGSGSRPDLTDDEWHVVVVANDGNGNTPRVYVDGYNKSYELRGTDTGNPTYNAIWWDDMAGIELLGVGAAIAGDGAGNVSSTSSHFEGDIGYVCISDTIITDAQVAEMWDQFKRGEETFQQPAQLPARYIRRNVVGSVVPGNTAGVDTIEGIYAARATGTKDYRILIERNHGAWTSRSPDDLAPADFLNDVNAYGSSLSAFKPSPSQKFLACVQVANAATTEPGWRWVDGSWAQKDMCPTATSEEILNVFFDPNSEDGAGGGRDQIQVYPLGTAYTDTFGCAYWDYLSGASGAWIEVGAGTWMSEVPTNLALATHQQTVAWSADSSYMAVCSDSTGSSSAARGWHIYTISGAGATYSATIAATSGATGQTGVGCEHCVFFNDGTDDYVIFSFEVNDTATAANMKNGIAIFKRNSGTGTWEYDGTLWNNNVSVTPDSGFTFDKVTSLHIVGNDLYVGAGNSGAGTTISVGDNTLLHMQWNGTYFAEQTEPTTPGEDTVAFPDQIFPHAVASAGIQSTDDGQGVVVLHDETTGTSPKTVPLTVSLYDRDASTGALTYRNDLESILIEPDFTAKPIGNLALTVIPQQEIPDSDGQ